MLRQCENDKCFIVFIFLTSLASLDLQGEISNLPWWNLSCQILADLSIEWDRVHK